MLEILCGARFIWLQDSIRFICHVLHLFALIGLVHFPSQTQMTWNRILLNYFEANIWSQAQIQVIYQGQPWGCWIQPDWKLIWEAHATQISFTASAAWHPEAQLPCKLHMILFIHNPADGVASWYIPRVIHNHMFYDSRMCTVTFPFWLIIC